MCRCACLGRLVLSRWRRSQVCCVRTRSRCCIAFATAQSAQLFEKHVLEWCLKNKHTTYAIETIAIVNCAAIATNLAELLRPFGRELWEEGDVFGTVVTPGASHCIFPLQASQTHLGVRLTPRTQTVKKGECLRTWSWYRTRARECMCSIQPQNSLVRPFARL